MDDALEIQQRSLSRSAVLKLGAVAALVLGAGPAARAVAGTTAPAGVAESSGAESGTATSGGATRVRGPRHLRLATYLPLVGTTFRIHREGSSPLQVDLASATRVEGVGESFSLIFRAHGNAKLGQEIYTLEHPSLGKFPLFLVPVGRATKGRDIQAIVNRIPASLMPRV
jgi:hypothetical protein